MNNTTSNPIFTEDFLKGEVVRLKDELRSVKDELRNHTISVDRIPQDDLRPEFYELRAFIYALIHSVNEDIATLVAETQSDDYEWDMNGALIRQVQEKYTSIITQLKEYDFLYTFTVTGSIEFKATDVKAKDEEEAKQWVAENAEFRYSPGLDIEVEGVSNMDAESDY